jgi:hypothetical protein
MSNAFIQALLMDDPDAGGGCTTPTPASGDPYHEDVLLLLLGDDPNGSLTFTDSSIYARTVTNFNNPFASVGKIINTNTQSAFGRTAIYGGTPGEQNELRVSQSGAEWATNDWCIDSWVYLDRHEHYFGLAGFNNGNAYFILKTPWQSGSNELMFNVVSNVATGGTPIGLGAWVHVAMTHQYVGASSSIIKFYVNGILDSTHTPASAHPLQSIPASTYRIGLSNSGGFAWISGYLNGYRVTAGTTRYSGNFTPPGLADYGPYVPAVDACTGDPDWADVALALNFNQTNGSLTMVDSSSYADNKTINSGAAISTLYAKYGSASLQMTYLQASTNPWTGLKFNSVAGKGATIEFYLKVVSSYSGVPGLTILKVADATFGTAIIEVGLHTTGNVLRVRFQEAFADFRNYTYTPDASGWEHVVICVGAAGGARVYVNQTLLVSRPNTEHFSTGAFGNLTTGCTVYVASWGATTALSVQCYLDSFRYTTRDKYLAGVPAPSSLPLCNGAVDICGISIPGTEALSGMGMTATAGDLNSPAGFRRLSGQAMTTATGSTAVYNPNVTRALTGQNMTTYRGTLTALPYPDLLSDTKEFIFSPVWESVFLTVLNNGTFTISETDLSTPSYTGNWLAPTTMDVTTIASQYRGTAMTNYGAGTLDYTDLAPTALFSVSTTATSSVQKIHHFSITVVPTVTNPRYGEVGYQGVLRFRLALKLP